MSVPNDDATEGTCYVQVVSSNCAKLLTAFMHCSYLLGSYIEVKSVTVLSISFQTARNRPSSRNRALIMSC